MKPFLKWAGGKYKLLGNLMEHFPVNPNGRFFDVFGGGGSVTLNISSFNYKQIIYNDINPDLIAIWNSLQSRGEGFIGNCEYYFTSSQNCEETYYHYRNVFNDGIHSPEIFIYLNKHCFNGLCRYNSKNKFNVPYGHKKVAPSFPRKEMESAYQVIKTVTFLNREFEDVLCMAKEDDVFYCDPPYIPISDSSYFTAYSKEGFGMDKQVALSGYARDAQKKGATVVISNSDTPTARKLYKGAEIYELDVQRNISCKGSKREKAKEIIAVFTP